MGTNIIGKLDSFNCLRSMKIGDRKYFYYSFKEAEKNGLEGISKLPNSLKVLLENLLRYEDGTTVTKEDIKALVDWGIDCRSDREIAYRPTRVLMQDFTGVPAVVDLAAMRDAMTKLGGDPKAINPLSPVDLVIDHSVMIDKAGNNLAFASNVEFEYQRNNERYTFLRWGANAFSNFRTVPPGTGICHQVNLEYLGQTIWSAIDDSTGSERLFAFPDSVVGTDSHTTMINGLAVLGWGVGGIEAEAAMLGQPVSMLIPEVIGFELSGKLAEGCTATDLVLTVTEMLRKYGVVGKFVEFYGTGLDSLSLEDQATIANMAPEYGATCGFFSVSDATLKYLNNTARAKERIELVEAYAKEQGMFRHTGHSGERSYTDRLKLDMSQVEPVISGPKRPQDKILLKEAASSFSTIMEKEFKQGSEIAQRHAVEGKDFDMGHGDIVIASITSCTNTSNPSVLIGAGLLAKKANEKGLKAKPWVKTSLAPGSQVVGEYLQEAGLQSELDQLGFNLVAYGCTTCIGNSGPLEPEISKAITDNSLVACSVLSGNRNFEGRINPHVRANFLASPPLVVAYAIAGTLRHDITKDPLGNDKDGNPVYLKDIWPSMDEIQQIISKVIKREVFARKYSDVLKGDENWQKINSGSGLTYDWNVSSTYVQQPPYFEDMKVEPTPPTDIIKARILGLFGDSITTDHISPAGAIKEASPAGTYLNEKQIKKHDFNSYGSRRGNHEVMMRGTFANIRIKNQMVPGSEGGVTIHYPSGEQVSIYDAAMKYRDAGVPLVVLAGKEYGTGSSRDWAAKGTNLLGIRAVIAQSFERIHRSNLVGMGVLPLTFNEGDGWDKLGLKGDEIVTIDGVSNITPRCKLSANITYADGKQKEVELLCRIDTEDELEYYKNGGILHYVLRNLARGK